MQRLEKNRDKSTNMDCKLFSQSHCKQLLYLPHPPHFWCNTHCTSEILLPTKILFCKFFSQYFEYNGTIFFCSVATGPWRSDGVGRDWQGGWRGRGGLAEEQPWSRRNSVAGASVGAGAGVCRLLGYSAVCSVRWEKAFPKTVEIQYTIPYTLKTSRSTIVSECEGNGGMVLRSNFFLVLFSTIISVLRTICW